MTATELAVSPQSARAQRLWRALPAFWVGVLLCIAFVATPAPFATLEKAQAGLVVAYIFAREAPLSLFLGMVMVLLERHWCLTRQPGGGSTRPSPETLLALGAVFCTVAGYYGLQPMMSDAKAAKPTPLSFAMLHGLSFGLFGLKLLLVSVLAWRLASPSNVWPAKAKGVQDQGLQSQASKPQLSQQTIEQPTQIKGK